MSTYSEHIHSVQKVAIVVRNYAVPYIVIVHVIICIERVGYTLAEFYTLIHFYYGELFSYM